MSNEIEIPPQHLRNARIVAGALVVSPIAFAVVAIIVLGALSEPADDYIFTMVGIVFAVGAFVLHTIAPSVFNRSAMQHADHANVDELCQYHLRGMVPQLAPLEGAAFLNIIAVIMEHNWLNLAVAGVLVLWMVVMFPTENSIKQWVEARQFEAGG